MKITAFARARPEKPNDADKIAKINAVNEKIKNASDVYNSLFNEQEAIRKSLLGGQSMAPATQPSYAPPTNNLPNPNANVQIGVSKKIISDIARRLGTTDKATVWNEVIKMGLNPEIQMGD
jgi:hypothetical protein